MNVNLRKKFGMISKVINQPKRAIISLCMLMFSKDQDARRIASWTSGSLPRIPITEVFAGIEKIDVIILRASDRLIGLSLDAIEVLILVAIVKYTRAKNILEIGTYDGNTALNIAANSSDDAVITTVDLPPDWNGQFELKVPHGLSYVIDRTKIGSQYKNTKYSEKIKQVFSDSAKIDWSKMPTPFDLVFIDGCHDYEYVRKDTQNAMKYLKSGGILLWHDYGMLKDVSRLVDETAKTIKVKVIQGTRLAVGFIE